MRAFLANPADTAAIAMVSAKDPSWNATLRTTCVATMLDAGHATNALPQRARANVNCRIFPGVDREEVRRKLEELVADTEVKVTTLEVRNENPPVPPLTRAIMDPLEKLTAKYFPGVPIVPLLQAGGTDGAYFNSAGIPTYGIMPIFIGPDLGNIHGLNEYVSVESLLIGRDFLHELIQSYASQK
jgi:acetylornithine deacetylase/succinyl-diaminopimelate desuccinylase-like protein